MYGLILAIHLVASSFLVGSTLLTLAGAWFRRGYLKVSRWSLLCSGLVTVLSGAGLIVVTGQGMGRVCLLGTALVAGAWGAYRLLRLRTGLPVPA